MTRIERAARALHALCNGATVQWDVNEKAFLLEATVALAAAYPELNSDPPTAWLAPWEATAVVDRWLIPEDWENLRDAHLEQQP